MTRAIKLLFLLPFIVVAIAISVANRHLVVFSLDPFAADEPAWSITLPLFWLLFAALAAGVVLGGFATWLRQAKWRRAARREHAEVERLRHQEHIRPAQTALPSPAERP
jgi:uncharacterized integral membrane protein